MLVAECERGHVDIRMNAREVAVEGTSGEFRVACSAGEFTGGALVVATGGLSIPEMGATAGVRPGSPVRVEGDSTTTGAGALAAPGGGEELD